MLDLYERESCPFSAKVRDFIESNNLKSQVRYIDLDEDESAEDRLQAITGRTQVPVLMIDGRALPESDAIISWFQTNLVGAEKSAQSARP